MYRTFIIRTCLLLRYLLDKVYLKRFRLRRREIFGAEWLGMMDIYVSRLYQKCDKVKLYHGRRILLIAVSTQSWRWRKTDMCGLCMHDADFCSIIFSLFPVRYVHIYIIIIYAELIMRNCHRYARNFILNFLPYWRQ